MSKNDRKGPPASPAVSVIIPCYNLGAYIDEAVDSVLRQTMQDFEIIIVDDGSSDAHTQKLLADYPRPKTTVYVVKNRGPAAARNLGIAKAHAPLILPLDADDMLESTCLEKASQVMNERPDVGVVSFWYRAFGAEEWEFKPESCSLQDILVENKLCGNSMFRRSAWEEVGGYDESFRTGYEDWEFWIRLLDAGYKAYIIPEFLFCYRVREKSMIWESNLPPRRNTIMEMLINKNRELYQEHGIEVLVGKEKVISGLMDYQRQLREAQRWHQGQLTKLLEAKEWFLQQLENHKAAMTQQQAEIARQRQVIVQQQQAIAQQQMDIARLDKEITQMRSVIDLKDHELRSVYASKVWKLGCAIRDARHSFRAAAILPFRIVDIGCPNSIRRVIRKLLLIEPHEVIKKNVHKFPYRLADRLLPLRLKEVLPYQLRNMARALFRTTNERIFRLEKWDGPMVSVIIRASGNGSGLERSLESVSNQTIVNYEVILAGRSIDEDVCKGLQSLNGRAVKRCQCPQGFSLGEGLNYAIKEAKGKYICCIEEDVEVDPTLLEKALFIAEVYRWDILYPDLWPFLQDQRFKEEKLPRARILFAREVWERIGGYKYFGQDETEFDIDIDFIERALWYGFRPFFHSMPHTMSIVESSGVLREGGHGHPGRAHEKWDGLLRCRRIGYIAKGLRCTYVAKNPFINLL